MKKIMSFCVVLVLIIGGSSFSFAEMGTNMSGMDMQNMTKESNNTGAVSESNNAGNKICPVSNDKITEASKSVYEYEGKTYNLCCAACIEAFKNDPAKYIQKVNEELNAAVEKK